jgi:hypothetical protein
MAMGRRWRRILWAGLVILGALAVVAFVFRDDIALHYHKNRLLAAKARHWRLTTKGYSGWDHISEVLRGRPVSADDVVATWKRHEEALVRRGFLSRATYVSRTGLLPSRSTDPAYNQALAHMEASCPWWSISRAGTNLVVTACAKGLADWKREAAEAGLISTDEVPPTPQNVKKKCLRKRRNTPPRETLALTLTSVSNTIDDELIRARVFLDTRRLPPADDEP